MSLILSQVPLFRKLFQKNISSCTLTPQMQRNFDLQLRLQETEKMSQSKDTKTNLETDTRDWMSAFNTSLLTTRANFAKDRSQELARLMQTQEFASLLVGAQHLADQLGLKRRSY